MAVDAEVIGTNSFNLKFKNYLRDFYVFQFKEKGVHFKAKGIKKKAKEDKGDIVFTENDEKSEKPENDKIILDNMFNADSLRLKYALPSELGIVWSNGDYFDSKTNSIVPNRVNKRVECITADTRRLQSNPFFELYDYCSDFSRKGGYGFSLVYSLLVYYNLGKYFCRNGQSFTDYKTESSIKKGLIELALKREAEDRGGNVKDASYWSTLPNEKKRKYAQLAIDDFLAESVSYRDGYEYIALNNKTIVFENDEFIIKNNSLGFVNKKMLFAFMQTQDLSIGEKGFTNKLKELTCLGILKEKKEENQLFYALSDMLLSNFVDNDDLLNRLTDLVSFFSQSVALGEVGKYILQKLPKKTENIFYYKHNYLLSRALNDYNVIDLLSAIKNKLWIEVEYRNATAHDLKYQRLICYPLEIRDSVTNGRQHLIYYHPKYRSVSAIRVDFIDKILVGHYQEPEFFDDDIERAKVLNDCTWGTSFDNFKEGNVKSDIITNKVRILISCSEEESYIEIRVRRETRNILKCERITHTKYGECLEITGNISSFREITSWLRSLTTRILLFEVNGKEDLTYLELVNESYDRYTRNTNEKGNKKSNFEKLPVEQEKVLLNDDNSKFRPDYKYLYHNILFNNIFSKEFRKLGLLLEQIIESETIDYDLLRKLFKKAFHYEIVNDREKKFDVFIDHFTKTQSIKRQSSIFAWYEDVLKPKYSLINGVNFDSFNQIIPLTTVEIQWLRSILINPFAKMFLSEVEITKFLNWLQDEELFDINSIVVYDKFLTNKDFYLRENFGEIERLIISSIKKHNKVFVNYKAQGKAFNDLCCCPIYLEFSKRDDTIRLIALNNSNKVMTLNLERIISVKATNLHFDKEHALKIVEDFNQKNERNLILLFKEEKNVPDRILNEFSCYKKKCIKYGDDNYRMILYYDKNDTLEIVVRILAYGPYVTVSEDTGDVKSEITKRLKHQLLISRELEHQEKDI